MSHTVDRVRWLFGRNAVRVHAVSRSGVLEARGFATPDAYLATVEFEGNAFACFESCWILPNSLPSVVDNRMSLIFANGRLEFDAGDLCLHQATPAAYKRPGTLWTTVGGTPPRVRARIHPALRRIRAIRERPGAEPGGRASGIAGDRGHC